MAEEGVEPGTVTVLGLRACTGNAGIQVLDLPVPGQQRHLCETRRKTLVEFVGRRRRGGNRAVLHNGLDRRQRADIGGHADPNHRQAGQQREEEEQLGAYRAHRIAIG
jgi:hypothetical protein